MAATHSGARASPLFILESVANELPFIVVYWLVADTALAAAQGDIDSPLGGLALAIAVCTLVGSSVVIGQAAQAGAALDEALTIGLGDNWRAVVKHRARAGKAPFTCVANPDCSRAHSGEGCGARAQCHVWPGGPCQPAGRISPPLPARRVSRAHLLPSRRIPHRQ